MVKCVFALTRHFGAGDTAENRRRFMNIFKVLPQLIWRHLGAVDAAAVAINLGSADTQSASGE